MNRRTGEPGARRYTKSHEWVEPDAVGRATVGVTRHARGGRAPVRAIRLPPVGERFAIGAVVAALLGGDGETPVYCPVSGIVEEINPRLAAESGLLEADPEGEGWLFRMSLSRRGEFDLLVDEVEYRRYLLDADLVS